MIALGILVGAIIAGLAWAAVNSRADKRGVDDALIFPPRVLIAHVAGAALTLILGALILTGVIS
jgi:2-keto-4-pentenoate hydratase/2-oxohepta-3-ene-1,7-dioic acid hydratase in catechol pathway